MLDLSVTITRMPAYDLFIFFILVFLILIFAKLSFSFKLKREKQILNCLDPFPFLPV